MLTRCLMSRSVVIKVGMVGDSQIGKTSLMVKYVEGSFDEDYIQTLGALWCSSFPAPRLTCWHDATRSCRRQFHGEDHLSAADDDYLLNMGLGWSARVRQHATARLQRCCSHLVHV